MSFKTSFSILLLLLSSAASAQNIKFEHYNTEMGLSHNSVRHIVQDSNGFLWLGTFSGLNRFDGYEFKNYFSTDDPSNSIKNDDITALEFDKDQNELWIGTRDGLNQLDLDTYQFTNYAEDGTKYNGLPDKEIRAVHVDRFKRVWVGTKTRGLYCFYPESQEFVKIILPGFQYIKEIYEEKDGNIWVGSYETAGVAKIVLDEIGNVLGKEIYNITVPETGEKNPYLNFIYEDHKSDIYVGTRQGLYKLDLKTNAFKEISIKDPSTRVAIGPYFISITRDPSGLYWVGTLGGILKCSNLDEIAHDNFDWLQAELSNPYSLVDNQISELFFDNANVLWVGTDNGLEKYDPYDNQLKLNQSIGSLVKDQTPIIRGFANTFDQNLIVATRHNGLFVLKDEQSSPLLSSSENIASIYSNNGRTFYCGLWDGDLLVYHYPSGKSEKYNLGLGRNPILSIAPENDNTLWVSSFGGGVVRFNKNSMERNVALTGYQINKILPSKDKSIWLATETGIVNYFPETLKIKVYKTTDGLPHENVSDLVFDGNGTLWASTRLGLCSYNPVSDTFLGLEAVPRLKEKWITEMLVTNDNDLWLNINDNTIGHFWPEKKEVKIYHANSGNRLDVFSNRGFYLGDNSKIYLGGKSGIISFSTNFIEDNTYSPPPIISEIQIHNKEVSIGQEINGQIVLPKDINISHTLTLEDINKNIAITLTAPSYTNERFNLFRYKLEGFDRDWTTVDITQRKLQYTNLFFGDYTLRAQARNSNGYWSSETKFDIKILPPFWLTYKAFVLYLLILFGLILLGRKIIKSRMKLHNQLLLEKIQREKDEKLANEKLRFFTNISHELRTPLTLILGPAKQLVEDNQNKSNQTTLKKLNHIVQNANRLLNLVNQVLDFRKADSGELKLKVSQTDIKEHTESVLSAFKELANEKLIQFNAVFEQNTILGWIDHDKYDKILFNLLSNALKFTNKYGAVQLFLGFKEKDNNTLVIRVIDNGIGIPKESQDHIFERFYQAENSVDNNTGSGIGLSLVLALISIHRGKIDLKSEINEGTEFTVELPINKNAYKNDEILDFNIPIAPIKTSTELPNQKLVENTSLKEKILIVEDNSELRQYLKDYLSTYYLVIEATNGKDGLELSITEKPLLCVVDVMMPIMDGIQFCKSLKNNSSISHIPVILLTALSQNDDKIKGYSVGADGYLTKPFDPSVLRVRIENIIESRISLKKKFSGETDSGVELLTHSPADKEFMEKVSGLINKNISNELLTTSYLCHEMSMSSSKLYRKIKELSDLAPNEFIRTIRLKKAVQLLKSQKYNVSEVTDVVGFKDPQYFSRCFKKQFGFPPSKLIK